MTSPLAVLLGAVAVAAACASPSPRDPAPPVRLAVTAGPSTTVAVVADATEGAVAGTYALSVERRGAAGTSTSRQSGAFDVAAGTRDTLAVSRVNAVPGDVLVAELVVESASGVATRDKVEVTVADTSGR